MEKYKLYTRQGLERQRARISQLEQELATKEKQVYEVARQTANVWHDNAPYESLMEEINQLSKRIIEARGELNCVEIIEYPKLVPETVHVGVGVIFERDSKAFNLKIVGYGDQDIDRNRVLYEAPISQALMGHRIGDSFEAKIVGKTSQIRLRSIYIIKDEDLVRTLG